MAKVKKRRGVTTVSSKNQITIPVSALRDAGLRPGSRLRVGSTSSGRIVLEQIDDPIALYAGSLTGRINRVEIEGLRDEWD